MLEIAWTFYIKVGFTLIAFYTFKRKKQEVWVGRYGWSLFTKQNVKNVSSVMLKKQHVQYVQLIGLLNLIKLMVQVFNVF